MFRTVPLSIIRNFSLYTQQWYTWFVPKVSVLIFYVNVYWTHLKLQVISFKV